jgi:antitoxin HigA-1
LDPAFLIEQWFVLFLIPACAGMTVTSVDNQNEGRADMKKKIQLNEVHPGEILLEDFMRPMSITARQLSSDMDVPPSRISDIVNGARPITADTALRLGLFFGMDARYWLNLQSEYDVRVAKRDLLGDMKARVRVYQHATNDPNVKLTA